MAALWGALFLLGAAVQFNDPDPLGWAAVYLAAAAVCLAATAGRLRWWMPIGLGSVALVWALSMVPRAYGRVPVRELFGEMAMASVAIEEAREMYGLFIIAAVMAGVAGATALCGRHAAPKAATPPEP